MRRRRAKNTLLWRIFGISMLVHVLALPILAHYGAFKKIEQHFLDARLVTLPPPPREAKQEARQPKKEAKRVAPAAHKAAGPTQHNRQVARQAPMNIPKVVASAGGPGAGGAEPEVAANGTGKVGEVPTAAKPAAPTVNNSAAPAPAPKAPETAKPAPAPATAPKPAETPRPEPKHEQPAVPKTPVYTEVAATFSPQPVIPDDLRGVDLDKTFIAEFTVNADGSPTSIKVAQSTGIDELDRIALETARKWKFKPATRDGQPVESIVRLHIEFQVS